MFSKNIIALLCVVCFVEICSTNKLTEIPGTSEVTEKTSAADSKEEANDNTDEDNDNEWKAKWFPIFNKYDGNTDNSLFPVELQSLLFNESVGFVTILQAMQYILFLNESKRNVQLGFENFERMKPIMSLLSKRVYSEDNIKEDDNQTMSVHDFRDMLSKDFKILFETEDETNEIIRLLGQKENDPIEFKMIKMIKSMLPASIKLLEQFSAFLVYDEDRNKVITDEEVLKVVKGINKEFTIENAKAMIQSFDDNHDNVIDFPEFVRMMSEPVDYKKSFIAMFGNVPHVTRQQIIDYFLKVFNIEVSDEDLEKLDPGNKNEITFNDIKVLMEK